MTHDADIRCCGVQADWNSQPAKPVGDCKNGASSKLPNTTLRTSRNEALAANATARIAALVRLLSHTANAIIKSSEAKAENQVRPISASHPLTCRVTAK